MFNDVIVFNRAKAKKYSYLKNNKSSILISISDIDKENPIFNRSPDNGIKAVLKVSFKDTDDKDTSISPETAKRIVNFVKLYANCVDIIVVHCEAGQSRSAGCAAAILKYYFNDDSKIFDDPKYKPNMFVFRNVLNEFIEQEYGEKV